MDYIVKRMKEPSTWRGVAMLAMGLGLGINPEQIEAILTIGTSVVGAIGVFAPDNKANATEGAAGRRLDRRPGR